MTETNFLDVKKFKLTQTMGVIMFNKLVFIGRFRPFTKAHQYVINEGLKQSEQIIVMIGSCFAPRSPRNAWVFSEVEQQIRSSFDESTNQRLIIIPLEDFTYSDHLWVKRVQELASQHISENDTVGLLGHSKDNSSYYLKLFPTWGSVNVDNYQGINATVAREAYFSNISEPWTKASKDVLPESVIEYLLEWRKTKEFSNLYAEYDFIRQYRVDWGVGPFMTADSIVIQAGHILLIKRAHLPGKGLWALPGGFMDHNETLLETAVRELREETCLDVPKGVISGYFVKAQLFDVPHRDPRARIITQAHLFDLDNELGRKAKKHSGEKPLNLTKIKASSDAAHAEWVPLSKIKSEDMFADHYHIIRKMIS